MPPTVTDATRYARDLAERVLWTFLQAFAAALIAGGVLDVANVRDVSAWQAAALGGVAAVLSLVKGLVAKFAGQSDSASTAPGV
jgi:hypothetical protein